MSLAPPDGTLTSEFADALVRAIVGVQARSKVAGVADVELTSRVLGIVAWVGVMGIRNKWTAGPVPPPPGPVCAAASSGNASVW